MTATKLTVPQMQQLIRDTFEDVASVEQFSDNPNICGYWLFLITDSQGNSGRVWVTPEGEIITPKESNNKKARANGPKTRI